MRERMTNDHSPDMEIRRYQAFLDTCFPIGALCVEFIEEDGRLFTTGLELVTGRILCTGADRNGTGGWRHRLMIDPRRSVKGSDDVVEVWVSSLLRHNEISDLWEAAVVTEGSKECVLRLLADPEPPWRPTPAMRRAVTRAHGVKH